MAACLLVTPGGSEHSILGREGGTVRYLPENMAESHTDEKSLPRLDPPNPLTIMDRQILNARPSFRIKWF